MLRLTVSGWRRSARSCLLFVALALAPGRSLWRRRFDVVASFAFSCSSFSDSLSSSADGRGKFTRLKRQDNQLQLMETWSGGGLSKRLCHIYISLHTDFNELICNENTTDFNYSHEISQQIVKPTHRRHLCRRTLACRQHREVAGGRRLPCVAHESHRKACQGAPERASSPATHKNINTTIAAIWTYVKRMCCLHLEYRQASAVGCPDTSACFEFHFSNSFSFLSSHLKLAQVCNKRSNQWE